MLFAKRVIRTLYKYIIADLTTDLSLLFSVKLKHSGDVIYTFKVFM